MKLVLIIPAIAALVALMWMFVQLLWNAVVVDVFPGVHAITFWQAAGLSILCGLLIRGGTQSAK